MVLKDYKKTESSNIDFKEKLEISKPKSWLKSVSAFANTNGGVLLFGLKDKDASPIGIKDIKTNVEKATELINNKIQPLPRYEIETFVEDEKDFMIITVGDGPKTPYYYVNDGRSEAFVRAGDNSIPAPKHILNNLILKGQNTTYDELTSQYKIKELSFTLLSAALKKETGKEIGKFKDYISLELVDKNELVTNGGLLLSDQGILPQSKICCTRWNGLTKGIINKDAIDDKEYTGSIISLLENAETFIKNNSKSSWEIDGMKRVEKEDYPIRAVREALVNAIIHRDYQLIGSEIHVDMFDDRLEITSPGGMVDGSYIQNVDIHKIPSIRRNRVLSDIFTRLHYMDKRGSGLIRILESYSETLQKPQFFSESSFFNVMLPNNGYILKKDNMEEEFNLIDDKDYFFIKIYKLLPKTTKKTYDRLIELFNQKGYVSEFSKDEIEKIFKVKKSRSSEIISKLLQADLIRVSSSKKYKFKK